MMKRMILVCAAALACAAYAYLPPVEDRCGIKVEIGSFPQKTERTGILMRSLTRPTAGNSRTTPRVSPTSSTFTRQL